MKSSRASPGIAAARRQALVERMGTDKPVLSMMPSGGGRIIPTNPDAETTIEAYKGAKWTAEQAAKVLKHHGQDFGEMAKDLGQKSIYSAKHVLSWLGY